MALLRFPLKVQTTAILNPSESTTFSAMTPGQTTTFSTQVPRNFKVYGDTRIYFPAGLPAGLLVSPIAITGAAFNGFFTATYEIYNGTSNTITPATQPVIIYQVP